MNSQITRPVRLLLAVAASATFAGACGDDDPVAPLTVVGVWSATSFTAQGSDYIALGMELTLTLSNTGSYTLQIVGDLIDACGGEEDCTETGPYTSTSTTLTIDPELEDEITFNYTLQGSTMTWTGSIDEIPATIVFTRSTG